MKIIYILACLSLLAAPSYGATKKEELIHTETDRLIRVIAESHRMEGRGSFTEDTDLKEWGYDSLEAALAVIAGRYQAGLPIPETAALGKGILKTCAVITPRCAATVLVALLEDPQ